MAELMQTQVEIERLRVAVDEVYDAVEAKGGTVPEEKTVGNLPEAIANIPLGVNLNGYNYSNPSSIEGIGQAIFPWSPLNDVTEIVDNYTDMTIVDSNNTYVSFNVRQIFPNLQKLTFTKAGSFTASGSNKRFLQNINVPYLSLPFTSVSFNNTGTGILYNTSVVTTIEFPLLTIIAANPHGGLLLSCGGITSLTLPEYVGDANTRQGCFATSCSALTSLTLPKFKYFRTYQIGMVSSCAALQEVLCPQLESIDYNGTQNAVIFSNCAALKYVQFGTITSVVGAGYTRGISNVDLPNLEKLEVGQDTQVLPSLARWTAANVADDVLLNTNIATYLAGRLYDYTGGTAHSITISTALYNRLTQATKDIFTNKNWTIATA